MSRQWWPDFMVAGLLGRPVAALANVIYPSTVVASSSYAGYPATDAIDTGANHLVTDWATNGGGVGGYLDITLPRVELLSSVELTDRTTSGGANGTYFGGTAEFTTQFELQVYTSASFTTTVGAPVIFTKSVPVSPTSPAAFAFTGSFPSGLDAEYLRYTIMAVDGSTTNYTASAGLADISFETVPEPSSLAIFAAATLILGLEFYSRKPVQGLSNSTSLRT